ncbi:MCE family protein [Streptomyces daliensis]|uniref:MCE family protein n=1 Tax=Streptomyces daliensis TaxID=299421 RepID=A0A8T4ISE4_9ACTN|nr:MCE family protein [Streptomyces daliensis]
MNRGSLTGPLVKSALFILVTVLATAVLAVSIANEGVGETERYGARFTDTTGLIEGDSVRVAGVKVGEVESIEVVDKRFARVEFSLRKGRTLPASTTATVKYLNMVGQRYISLQRGVGPVGEVLRPGDTIPLRNTTPALDLTQLFNGFQPLFQGLSPHETNKLAGEIIQVLQGEGGTVESLVASIGSLTTTLAKKDKAIGAIIDNLNTVLDTVNTREKKFTTLIGTLRKLVSGFSRDREALGESVGAMSELTTTTADLFHDGRRPLKESVEGLGQVSGTLAASTPEVERFLEKTPAKMDALTRMSSYGSWLNLYLCEARVSGVSTSDGSGPPTGLPVTEGRCER